VEGRQAYWVCPLIEESEKLELQTAVALHLELTAAYAALGLRVGLVHGRMKPDEKAATMDAFSRGEILGARQSGVPLLRFADLERDAALIEPAREAADWLLDAEPDAAAAHLARWLGARAEFVRA
jgi:RecG-like helicase